ncbi:M48 family metalloprotease, partial [Sphingopyxis sp.]|uniref:M48 family metalloprotease n=1 Tax=Sphingopyxis sp. TaxID=1908224 RepID=UPI0035B17B25
MPRSPRGPGRTHPQGRAAARARALSRAEPAAERLRPGQPRGQRIWVTDGLLGLLDGRELAGVLAHEIGHIANRDLWIMSLADMMSRLVSLASWLGQQNGDLSEGRSQVFQRWGGCRSPPDGIAMCHTRGVEAQAEGEGIHGRSYHHRRRSGKERVPG